MKPVLIHTHFHKRKTGITRSIENVLPFFNDAFDSYVIGDNIDGNHLTTKELKKLLFSDRKTIVHCHRNNEILHMLWFRFLGAKFKLIATRHAESKPSGFTMFLLKKADKVVTLIKSMHKNLGILNTLISHGVNVNEFIPDANQTIEGVQQPNIILNTGRIRKAKGQLTLIEAANSLKDYKDWALVFVGKVDKPPFLEELKTKAKELEIEKQVYFFPETRAILKYYQAAKLFVAPTFSEGFSLVTAEAMACDCTVFATENVGVHSEMISHKNNGYLFKSGNSVELQNLIQPYLEQKKAYLGTEARKEITQNWSAEKEAKELTNLYLSK